MPHLIVGPSNIAIHFGGNLMYFTPDLFARNRRYMMDDATSRTANKTCPLKSKQSDTQFCINNEPGLRLLASRDLVTWLNTSLGHELQLEIRTQRHWNCRINRANNMLVAKNGVNVDMGEIKGLMSMLGAVLPLLACIARVANLQTLIVLARISGQCNAQIL